MRKRRSEIHGEKSIAEVFQENTYGGTKDGQPAPQQFPTVTNCKGIKLEWEGRAGEYPTTVCLEMTDGKWVKYRIDIEQPGFTRAMDILKSGNLVRGYPPERR